MKQHKSNVIQLFLQSCGLLNRLDGWPEARWVVLVWEVFHSWIYGCFGAFSLCDTLPFIGIQWKKETTHILPACRG